MTSLLARWPYVLLLGLSTFMFSGMVFPWVAEEMNRFAGKEVEALDINPGFSPPEAYSFLESLGAEGRAFYQKVELTIDIAYPLVYGLFIVALLQLLLKGVFPKNSFLQKLALLGFLGSVFDILENTCIAVLIQLYPQPNDGLATLISVSGVLKFAFIGLGFVLAIFLLLAWGVKMIRK